MDLERLASKCASCGQCRPVCPAFDLSGNREPESPRGRVMLSRGIITGEVGLTSGGAQTLSGCLLCGSCVDECPSGVAVDHVVLLARQASKESRGLPAAKRLVNSAFSRPGLMAAGARIGSLALPLLGSSWPPSWWPGGDRRRLIPRPAGRPLSSRVRPESQPDFLLFRGCLIEHVMPEIGVALAGLSRDNGVRMGLIDDEYCCGIPHLAAGDFEGFHRLAERNIGAAGDGSLPVVTACATCTSTLRKYYAEFPPPGMEKEALAFSSRVVDAVRFIEDWDARWPSSPGIWTYHQPCHHQRGEDRIDGASILERMPAGRLATPSDPTACCGFAGSYSLDHYPRSRALASRRLEDLLATGARGVATACPGCMIHLRDAVARTGRRFAVRHLIELASGGAPEAR